MAELLFRQAQEDDLLAAARMYERLEADTFRRLEYHFPHVEDVGNLWVASFRRTLGRFSVLWVAEVEGTLAGFCLGRIKRVAPYLGGMLVGEVADIWVAPEGRGRNIGHTLLAMTVDWLWAQGIHSVEAQVQEGNTASESLFRSQGFQIELRQLRLMPPTGEAKD